MKQQQSIRLHSYWKELFAENGIPERSAIEPMSIRDILGDTFILEFSETGEINYRLAGTRLCALFGGELKGSSVTRAWPGEEKETIANILNSVTEDSVIALFGCLATSKSGQSLSIETLVLPLVQNGEKHKRLLGITTPLTRPYWLGMDQIVKLSLSSLRIIDPTLEMEPFNTRFTVISGKSPAISKNSPAAKRVKHLTVLEGGRSNAHNSTGAVR